ncbi:MAG: hypothetical protein ACRETQ_10425 [Gammaproteobacteria bacterium]
MADALVGGWHLFRRCLPQLFLPLWLANFVDAAPSVVGGGSVFTGAITGRGILLTLAAWLVESLLFGYTIARLDAVARNTRLPASLAWRVAFRATPAVLVGDLVYNIVAWGGLLLFLVPGIIFGTTLVFFAYAAVIDRKNLIEALGYSHALAWPAWWRTSVVISVPAIVLLIYSVISGWPAITSVLHAVAAGELPSIGSLSHRGYDLGLMPPLGALAWSYVLCVLYVQYDALKRQTAVH